jgi:uncharacterized membrane-anchored protein
MPETAPSFAKVPQVTLLFWVLKIIATTLGETAGDAVSMSMNLGYLAGTGIFAAVFLVAVVCQVRTRQFHPALYWVTIVATTTVGTTLADYATRSLGIGYAGGSALLLLLLVAALVTWQLTLGSIAIGTVDRPRVEVFYWTTIMFSQTLGTALGDWTVEAVGHGYLGAAVVFGALLALVAGAYFAQRNFRPALFWAAFILTRPLGAVLGDFLDKPVAAGGLNLSRFAASAVLGGIMVACLFAFPQRAADRAH